MAKTTTPEDFKFEDSKFKLVIDATGKEDGHTISNHLEAEVRCEEEFAISVIENFFEKDPEMESLFKKVILMRSIASLVSEEDLQKFEDALAEEEKAKNN